MRTPLVLALLAGCEPAPDLDPYLGHWDGSVEFDHDEGELTLSISEGQSDAPVEASGTMVVWYRVRFSTEHDLTCSGEVGVESDVGELLALACVTQRDEGVHLLLQVEGTHLVGYAAPVEDTSGSSNPCGFLADCSTYIHDTDADVEDGLFEAVVDEAYDEGDVDVVRFGS